MAKVIMSGIVPQMSEPVIPTKDFQIGDLAVGSPVWLNVNGVPTEFLVIHRGNPNTSMYDASCDGVWLRAKDIYTESAWISSSQYSTTYYNNSLLNSYLSGTFLGLLDAGVKDLIKQVKVPYVSAASLSAQTKTVQTGSNGVSAKVFLLSLYEMGLAVDTSSGSFMNKPDGAILDYYNGASNTKRIAYYNGAASAYWSRTYFADGYAYEVGSDGQRNYHTAITQANTSGVLPALILPYDALVNEDGVVIGEKGGA